MREKKVNKKFLIIGGILGMLALGQLWVSNRLVTAGVEMSATVKELASLNSENQKMRQQLAERAALSGLATVAEEQGFVPVGQVVALDEVLPVAEKLEVSGGY